MRKSEKFTSSCQSLQKSLGVDRVSVVRDSGSL